MKLKCFCLGILSASLAGYFGLLVFQRLENPVEKAKAVFLILVGLSTIPMFLAKDGRIKPLQRRQPKEQKRTHWASLAAARQPVQVESNTEEIHHLIEDLAVKAREANELIFQHKLEAQSTDRTHDRTEKSFRNS